LLNRAPRRLDVLRPDAVQCLNWYYSVVAQTGYSGRWYRQPGIRRQAYLERV